MPKKKGADGEKVAVAFRTDKETRAAAQREADNRGWSVSQVVDKIMHGWRTGKQTIPSPEPGPDQKE